MSGVVKIIVGTIAGALTGAVAGSAFAWGGVSRAYTGPLTFWTDCGPHIFVPVWLGAAVGLVSRLSDDSLSGLFMVALAGVGAGLLVPTVFEYAFGQPFRMGTAFMGIPYAKQIVLGFGGGVAAFFWFFSGNKLLR